jgi:hypothetical protein
LNIRISKGERKVTLAKRERDLLDNARALLAELSTVGGGDVSETSEAAADAIALALSALLGPAATSDLLDVA